MGSVLSDLTSTPLDELETPALYFSNAYFSLINSATFLLVRHTLGLDQRT